MLRDIGDHRLVGVVALRRLAAELDAPREPDHTDRLELVRVRDDVAQRADRLRERRRGVVLALGLARVAHVGDDVAHGLGFGAAPALAREEFVPSRDRRASLDGRRVDVLVVADVVHDGGDLDHVLRIEATTRRRERRPSWRTPKLPGAG